MKLLPTFADLGITFDGSDGTDLASVSRDNVIDVFRQHGLVLFSGFDVDTAKFETFTNLFSRDYMDHRGGGSLREVINKDGDRTILSVSYAYNPKRGTYENTSQRTFPLALHSDRSYTKTQPPLMWFYCVQPAKEEGETLVCDGVRLWQHLDERTKAFFAEHPIKYIRHYVDGEWQLWAQTESMDAVREYCASNDLVLTINPDDSVTTEYTCYAVTKPRWTDQQAFVNSMLLVLWQEEALNSTRSLVRMQDSSRIPDWALADIREVSDRLTREIQWEPGQIAMIDNTRLLHGRRGFDDPERRIYVRMSRSVDW